MTQTTHFKIDYLIHGSYKTFYIHSEAMSQDEALHWATIDAGLCQIPKPRAEKLPRLSRRQAEQLGLTDVEWAAA